MELSYDESKRRKTLDERGLDFVDAPTVFAGPRIDIIDDRVDYGEERWLTYGKLQGRMVAIVWTPRASAIHIISMRKANDRERKIYEAALGRPG